MFNAISQLIQLLDPQQKKTLFFLQALIIAASLLEVTAIASIGPFMAVATTENMTEASFLVQNIQKIFGINDSEIVFQMGIAVLILLITSSCVSLYATYKINYFGNNLGATLGCRLFDLYIRKNWIFHTQTSSSILVNNVLNEINRTTLGIINPGLIAFSKLVFACCIIISLLFINPLVTLVGAIIFTGSYIIIFTTLKGRLYMNGLKITSMTQLRLRYLSEGLDGVKDTLIKNKQDYFSSAFKENNLELATTQSQNQILAIAPKYLLESITFGTAILVTMFLSISEDQTLTSVLPLVAVYAVAGVKLMPALQAVFSNMSCVKGNLPGFLNIQADLEESKHNLSRKIPGNEIHFDKSICLNQIAFQYPGKNTPVLDNLNMRIEKLSAVGLVGPSGSGKSTIIDILLGLLEPTSGELLIDDTVINTENLKSWQDRIGYVPQLVFLSDASIAENIAYGVLREDIDNEKLNNAISMANLQDVVANLPDGINTVIGEKGIQLSGGQRQRIAIARALYNDPDILIFDEATSALDNITEQEIMKSINSLLNKKTIIIIAHRLATIEQCDQIFIIDDGKVTGNGTYNELLVKSRYFANLVNMSQID